MMSWGTGRVMSETTTHAFAAAPGDFREGRTGHGTLQGLPGRGHGVIQRRRFPHVEDGGQVFVRDAYLEAGFMVVEGDVHGGSLRVFLLDFEPGSR